jgi:hypothetical protein
MFYILVQAQPQCVQDLDCLNTEVCHQGSCVDACRLKHCGANAHCLASNHIATCHCDNGYNGNPESACYPCE